MFGLKDKFRELKEDAGTIKNNINELMTMLENEKKSILELQNEIQNNYNLIKEKINISSKKEEELDNLREESKQVKKELIESDIENKTLIQNIKIFTKDNKELKEKLYQKMQDEFKFKMLTNETSTNIKNFKMKMDEQNKIKDTSMPIDIETDLDQEVDLNNNREEIKKLLIQHDDHKLLDPLVNGDSIDNMEESDLINLSNLYNRLVEKGFREDSNVLEGKTPEVLEEITQLDEKELLEEVKSFKSDEWNQMFEWAKENKKLKNKDLSLLTGLAIRSSKQPLSDKELILGIEIYFILMSEGFKRVKDEDVDNFLMQFVKENESIEEIPGEYKINEI